MVKLCKEQRDAMCKKNMRNGALFILVIMGASVLLLLATMIHG